MTHGSCADSTTGVVNLTVRVRVVTRTIGGTSIPATTGWMTASWPLAVLIADDEGLEVDVRPRRLKRLFIRFASPTPPMTGPLWRSTWTEIGSIDFGRRSIATRPTHPGKGMRFATIRRSRLLPIVELAERHAVVVHRKRTTIPRYFSQR